jgi:polar amino acid transport system permease protein
VSTPGGGGPEKQLIIRDDPRVPEGRPTSKILGSLRAQGARGVAIAVLSTVIVVALVGISVSRSSSWPQVRDLFFSRQEFRDTFWDITKRLPLNIGVALVCELAILAFALLLAVMRSLGGPVFFPIRVMAVTYIDLFRGIPTIMVIYLLGFGVPGLQLAGLPTSALFWAAIGLVLSYSAYVAEVYRAGIESVHPSQAAAARSLGLSRSKTLRFVIVPQAVRRVVPPLLNDFIALQKDTALIAFVAPTAEAFKQAQINASADFNYTPIVISALLFVLLTIPQARFVDWLIARGLRRRQTGGGL